MKHIKLMIIMMMSIVFSYLNAQDNKTKYLDGLTPEAAIEYMKKNPDIYIIDVREDEWYDGTTQFTGNHHIPSSQITKKLKEIPSTVRLSSTADLDGSPPVHIGRSRKAE